MPAATNKADLIAVCDKEFTKLNTLLDGISTPQALVPDADGWSIKDIVAHRTHWSGLFFDWKEAREAGEDVQTPAPGYKWNQLKAYNAAVTEAAAAQNWTETRAGLAQAHGRMMDYLRTEDEARLYTPALYPWMNTWTLGRWAEAAAASHYRSAAKAIRKMLREQTQQ